MKCCGSARVDKVLDARGAHIWRKNVLASLEGKLRCKLEVHAQLAVEACLTFKKTGWANQLKRVMNGLDPCNYTQMGDEERRKLLERNNDRLIKKIYLALAHVG